MNRTDALVDVRRNLHERLIGRVDARQLDAMPRAERRLRVREEALSLLREQGHMLPQSALADVVNAVSDAVVGMGPIEFLLKDPEVTELMVNGPDDVYVERKGRIERVADRLFEGEEAVLHVIERIVAPLGLRVDATSPWVDARLPDGSRVQTRFLSAPFLTVDDPQPQPSKCRDPGARDRPASFALRSRPEREEVLVDTTRAW